MKVINLMVIEILQKMSNFDMSLLGDLNLTHIDLPLEEGGSNVT